MNKTILVTGSTDGIGLETAKALVELGHTVLLHERNAKKLGEIQEKIATSHDGGHVEKYVADLSRLNEVKALAQTVADRHTSLDVLINNAGVYHMSNPITENGLDARFVINTIAPYLLTKILIPRMTTSGRIINLSSAAQSPVSPDALTGRVSLPDNAAYAQSKLALTMWSCSMGLSLKRNGPAIIAINPGSMLGTKMVKQAFGVSGSNVGIGADILVQAALSDKFNAATGKYFDNDTKRFAQPHPDVLNQPKAEQIVCVIESILSELVGPA